MIFDMLKYRPLPFQCGMNHFREEFLDGVMLFKKVTVLPIYREIPIYKNMDIFKTAVTLNGQNSSPDASKLPIFCPNVDYH